MGRGQYEQESFQVQVDEQYRAAFPGLEWIQPLAEVGLTIVLTRGWEVTGVLLEH